MIHPAVRAAMLLAALLVSSPSAAQSERFDQVALSVASCPEPFEASLRQILAIELGQLLGASAPATPPRGDSIQIVCENEKLQVAARSAGGEQVVHNDLLLRAFPGDAAPRAAALAALEALRAVDPSLAKRIEAQRAEVRPDPARASATRSSAAPKAAAESANRGRGAPSSPRVAETRPPPETAIRPASVRRGSTRVLLGGVARFLLGDPKSSALGVRLELSRRWGASWDAGFDLEASFAERQVGLGAVEARLLSSAAWLGQRASGSVASGTVALGGRLGMAELSGSPNDFARGHRVLRPFAGPLLLVRGDVGVGLVGFAWVVEGGVAVVGANGLSGGSSAISLTSGWLATSVNVGVHF